MQIDAHQHFWRYSEADYGWIVDNGLDALKRDFLPSDLEPQMRAAGFDGTVAVQARQDTAETEWLLDLAREHPWIRGVVGWVDLRSDGLDAELERLHARSSRLVGVRHVIQDEPDGFMDDPALRRGVARLADHGLTYDLLIYERQLDEAVRFCAALDGQRIVLDHIAKPRIAAGELDAWSRGLGELAAMEHVACKLSGMVTEADWESWTPDDLRPYVERVLEAFGPERLMLGSDWPVCTLAADYLRVMDVARELAGSFPGFAVDFYGLPRDGIGE